MLARDGDGPPSAVWIDLTDEARVEIDTGWYRSHGLRASVSHRVVFHDAPVLARFGAPGALAAQPWFSRDALRTAASWAGMADTAVGAALDGLAARPSVTELEALAAGRILTAGRTIDAWLEHAAAAMDAVSDELAAVALHARAAISDACRTLLDEAARACGSRPFARAEALDRARRDLEVFLLQHRLDPLLARAGARAPWPVDEADDPQRLRGALPGRPRSVGLHVSGYERDKYAATLAACGPGPFAHALELGGSIGVFSAMLAPRCRRLTTIDAAPTAVGWRAGDSRPRLASTIIEASIPAGIPDGRYDLVVASEILYYLLADELDVTLDRIGRQHETRGTSRRRPLATRRTRAAAHRRRRSRERCVARPGCAPSTEPTRMPTCSTYWSAGERAL